MLAARSTLKFERAIVDEFRKRALQQPLAQLSRLAAFEAEPAGAHVRQKAV
jgi:hypothetical protein